MSLRNEYVLFRGGIFNLVGGNLRVLSVEDQGFGTNMRITSASSSQGLSR